MNPTGTPYPAGGTNKSTVDDIGFVGALLDQVEANYNIDTTRVYATGYSNGADMTYTAVCYLSDRFTGIAPQSGQMWQEVLDSCNPTHPTPVLHIHGTNDGARPYGGYDGYLVSIQEGLGDYRADHNQIVDAPELTEFQDGKHHRSNGTTSLVEKVTSACGITGWSTVAISGSTSRMRASIATRSSGTTCRNLTKTGSDSCGQPQKPHAVYGSTVLVDRT